MEWIFPDPCVVSSNTIFIHIFYTLVSINRFRIVQLSRKNGKKKFIRSWWKRPKMSFQQCDKGQTCVEYNFKLFFFSFLLFFTPCLPKWILSYVYLFISFSTFYSNVIGLFYDHSSHCHNGSSRIVVITGNIHGIINTTKVRIINITYTVWHTHSMHMEDTSLVRTLHS